MHDHDLMDDALTDAPRPAVRRRFVRLLCGAVAVGAAGVIAVATAGPAPAAPKAGEGSIRIGGSTTLLPIVTKCASDFMEKHETWDKVDKTLPADRIVIFVTGGGSGFGVKALEDETVDLGHVSRDLKDKEKTLLGDARTFTVGRDSVAVAVSRTSPLAKRKGFTSAEVAKIFSGETKDFAAVEAGLPATPIVLLVRDAGAGSAEVFQSLVMGDRKVSTGALQMSSQGALLKKLESNPNAVAYISSGLCTANEELHAFELDGVAPTNEQVVAGKYRLSRPLLVVSKGEPSKRAKLFIDHLLAAGQKVVADHGYVPAAKVE